MARRSSICCLRHDGRYRHATRTGSCGTCARALWRSHPILHGRRAVGTSDGRNYWSSVEADDQRPASFGGIRSFVPPRDTSSDWIGCRFRCPARLRYVDGSNRHGTSLVSGPAAAIDHRGCCLPFDPCHERQSLSSWKWRPARIASELAPHRLQDGLPLRCRRCYTTRHLGWSSARTRE